MQVNVKVQELLQLLSERGLKQEAIENVRDGLWSQANETFMSNVLSSLTDEDLQSVESASSQEEAGATLKRLFEEKSGKNMEEEMNRVVEQYAEELIKKYQMEEPESSASVISESVDTASSHEEKPAEHEDTAVHDLT